MEDTQCPFTDCDLTKLFPAPQSNITRAFCGTGMLKWHVKARSRGFDTCRNIVQWPQWKLKKNISEHPDTINEHSNRATPLMSSHLPHSTSGECYLWILYMHTVYVRVWYITRAHPISERESVWVKETERQKDSNREKKLVFVAHWKSPGDCEAVTDKTLHEYLAAKLKLQNTKTKKRVGERKTKKLKHPWKHQWDKCPPFIPPPHEKPCPLSFFPPPFPQ